MGSQPRYLHRIFSRSAQASNVMVSNQLLQIGLSREPWLADMKHAATYMKSTWAQERIRPSG